MNNITPLLLSLLATGAFAAPKPAEVVRSFLEYQYGGNVPGIGELCMPNPDMWMLHGADQPRKRDAIRQLEVKIGATGVFMDTIEQDICIVELRDGLVDPQFNLALVQRIHQELVLQFLYHSLLQDKEALNRLVTNSSNVSFGDAPKAANGDMDVYSNVLSLIPVVRVSQPKTDSQSQSVTYRLPLGDEIFVVRIVRLQGVWKIDTDNKVTVPLRYFWR
jgi:hypothetical protein